MSRERSANALLQARSAAPGRLPWRVQQLPKFLSDSDRPQFVVPEEAGMTATEGGDGWYAIIGPHILDCFAGGWKDFWYPTAACRTARKFPDAWEYRRRSQ